MNRPLVSVCIPNYNYGRYLEYCLESVYNQTYSNIEVIINDNSSTDNSYDIAIKYRKKFLDKGIYCAVGENKYNVGSDRNSKICANRSEGQYLYTLASDDAIKPTFIEECVNVFENNPSVGMVMTHREIIDENLKVTEEKPFYNQSCLIDGEEQAAVFMMAGIAIPGQRMTKRGPHLSKISSFSYIFQVAGDWFDNFRYACAADVAYIKKPLCQYRVHSNNETNGSELNILGIFEHYQLINAFQHIANSLGMQKPQKRYDEAIKKLGDMCLRYTMKMFQTNHLEIATKYVYLAPVFNPDILNKKQYLDFKACLDLTGDKLQKKVHELKELYVLERIASYDPPVGSRELDDMGRVLK